MSVVAIEKNQNMDRDIWFEKKFNEHMQKQAAEKIPSMTIISTKGTMDMAYPPFILASTAAALGWEVSVFFTFYGLNLLRQDLDLKITPAGNPGMPMKLPIGPKWLRKIDLNIPNVLVNNLPGFDNLATGLFNKTLKDKGVASIKVLRDACIEADVKLIACQMTVDLFNSSRQDYIPEVADWIGAASFLPIAKEADVSLFV